MGHFSLQKRWLQQSHYSLCWQRVKFCYDLVIRVLKNGPLKFADGKQLLFSSGSLELLHSQLNMVGCLLQSCSWKKPFLSFALWHICPATRKTLSFSECGWSASAPSATVQLQSLTPEQVLQWGMLGLRGYAVLLQITSPQMDKQSKNKASKWYRKESSYIFVSHEVSLFLVLLYGGTVHLHLRRGDSTAIWVDTFFAMGIRWEGV